MTGEELDARFTRLRDDVQQAILASAAESRRHAEELAAHGRAYAEELAQGSRRDTAAQVAETFAHSPTPHWVGISPSSLVPSQSLSSPSQTSADAIAGWQVFGLPSTQDGTVRAQAPTPQETSGSSSSVCPSQSLSSPSQTSVEGLHSVQLPR